MELQNYIPPAAYKYLGGRSDTGWYHGNRHYGLRTLAPPTQPMVGPLTTLSPFDWGHGGMSGLELGPLDTSFDYSTQPNGQPWPFAPTVMDTTLQNAGAYYDITTLTGPSNYGGSSGASAGVSSNLGNHSNLLFMILVGGLAVLALKR